MLFDITGSQADNVMHDPVHNGLDALLRRMGGERGAVNRYWQKLRGKTEPGSGNFRTGANVGMLSDREHEARFIEEYLEAQRGRGGRTEDMERIRRYREGLAEHGTMREDAIRELPPRGMAPVLGLMDPVLGEPQRGLTHGSGRCTDPNLRSRVFPTRSHTSSQNPADKAHGRPRNSLIQSPNRYPGQDEVANSTIPPAKPTQSPGGALIGLTKHQNQSMVGHTYLDMTNMGERTLQPPKQKDTNRVETKTQTARVAKSGPKSPTPQGLPAGPSKTPVRTQSSRVDKMPIAQSERKIGDMGRTFVQGMVSKSTLDEPETATLKRNLRR